MPQLPKTFDAYPSVITLDGSGNGTVLFQPNGSAISVSRLFVQVSSAIKQATVSLYKGSISPSTIIGTIVSGSTGGLASGEIFLTDGQTLCVVWNGGDAGATATATFSGRQVGFNEIGSDSITWTDPIAAADGTLVFPSIKSVNYVPGSAGWIINRDGTFELAGGTFRGDVEVDGANGSRVVISGTAGSAKQYFYPPPFNDPTVTANPAIIDVAAGGGSGDESTSFLLLSGYPQKGVQTGEQTALFLISGSLDGSFPSIFAVTTQSAQFNSDSMFFQVANKFDIIGGDLIVEPGRSASSTSNSAAISTTATAVLTIPSVVFKAGIAYKIEHGGGWSPSATNLEADFRIMKSTAGVLGGEYGEFYRYPTGAASLNVKSCFGTMFVKNATSSDITTDVALTLAVVGTGTATHAAGSGRQRWVMVSPYCDASRSEPIIQNATQVF